MIRRFCCRIIRGAVPLLAVYCTADNQVKARTVLRREAPEYFRGKPGTRVTVERIL